MMTVPTTSARRLTFEEILGHFTNVRSVGDHYTADCPSHASTSKTSVNIGRKDGRVLVHDFGGCATEDLLKAVGLTLADLFLDGTGGASTARGAVARPRDRDDLDIDLRCQCGSGFTRLIGGVGAGGIVCTSGHYAPAEDAATIAEQVNQQRRAARVEALRVAVAAKAGTQALLAADAVLLDAVHGFLGRFVAYPSADAHIAHTLWVVHTHLMDAWESTPRLAFLSPEAGLGQDAGTRDHRTARAARGRSGQRHARLPVPQGR